MPVVRSSSGGVAICYIIPVLWMTLCLRITARNIRHEKAYTQSYSTRGSNDLIQGWRILELARTGGRRLISTIALLLDRYEWTGLAWSRECYGGLGREWCNVQFNRGNVDSFAERSRDTFSVSKDGGRAPISKGRYSGCPLFRKSAKFKVNVGHTCKNSRQRGQFNGVYSFLLILHPRCAAILFWT